MTTLKEAVLTVLKAHPNEYIHVINEYKDTFQFALLNKGEQIGPYTFFYNTPLIDKHTGELDDTANIMDERFSGDYRQYTKDDLEGL